MPELNFIAETKFLQVHEGRNHEVRELVKNAGLKVSQLRCLWEHYSLIEDLLNVVIQVYFSL